MTTTSSTTASRTASNGFWSNLSSGLGEGLGRIGSEVLPIWAAKELKLQSIDQLQQTTYDPVTGLPRVPGQLQATTQGATIQVTDAGVSTNKTGAIVLAVGIGLAVAVLFMSRS